MAREKLRCQVLSFCVALKDWLKMSLNYLCLPQKKIFKKIALYVGLTDSWEYHKKKSFCEENITLTIICRISYKLIYPKCKLKCKFSL